MDRIVRRSKVRLSTKGREFLAEFMGTFILLMFGIGSVAQSVLSKGSKGGFLSINFGWGLGVTFGVYWSAGISGGHINPAVTLAMAVAGRLPWIKVPIYWLAQTLGSFMASALCFGIYKDLVDDFDPNQTLKTAGIWSTYPYSAAVSNATIFGDQFVGTMLLVGTVFALTDKRNNAPNKELLPIAIGFIVLVIGISFGVNVGYGINPARDLMPRIFTAIAGWKNVPFKTHNNFFWIPVIGQLCGGVAGALLYILTIEMHHPTEHEICKAGKADIEETPFNAQ